MSDVTHALEALRDGRTADAVPLLQAALEAEPRRVDLYHALGVALVGLGDPMAALALLERGIDLAKEIDDASSRLLLPQLALARATAYDELGLPQDAEAAFRMALADDARNPRVRVALGHLLLSWGRRDEGRAILSGYLDDRADEPEFLNAVERFIEGLDRFVGRDEDPLRFLDAHRGAYVEFFDETVDSLAAEGWIAEAAQMRRDERGQVVPVVPPDRPYAAVRVDVVNPQTSQPGQIGEEPMMVALDGFEGLAHAPVVFRIPGPLPVWVSSQCPWNQLPIRIKGKDPSADWIHGVIGPWFHAGWSGAFGTRDRGRFHFVSEPTAARNGIVQVDVDLGRAERRAIDDLIHRLGILYERGEVLGVLFGRGHLPV